MAKRNRSRKSKDERGKKRASERADAREGHRFSTGRIGIAMGGALLVAALAYAAYALLLVPTELPTNPRANVLVITLDTTRADRIGAYGHDRAETPNLDALAADGVRFDQTVSSVPLTLPAHSSLFTGVYPPRHGVRDNGGYFLDDRWTTLAEALRAGGRTTFAAVGAFVLHDLWGLNQGFDVYEDDFGESSPERHKMLRVQRDGAEVLQLGLDWLDEHGDEPFFAWLHFYDPHYPYEPPGEYAQRFADRPYDGEIAYTDSLVGQALQYLREKGLYDSTLIVVIGDHGESLGDHREPDHGLFLYDSSLRVPLIVRAPELEYRGVVEEVVRDIDVMPTVLAYTGIEPPDDLQGSSLLGLMAGRREAEPRYAYSETRYCRLHFGWAELASIRGPRFKLIEAPKPEIYDMSVDPDELQNLASRHAEIVERLRSPLDAFRLDTGDQAADAAVEIDPEVQEKLMALGYAGSIAPQIEGELPDPKDKLEEMNLLIRASRESAEMLDEKRFDEVVQMLEEVLQREPNYMDGYLSLSSAYHQLGQYDRAIEVLELALQKTPENINVMQGLGRAHLDAGDLEVASGLFETIIARTRRYPQAYFALAEARVAQARYDDAAATLGLLLELRPDTPMALYETGMAYLRAGRFDSAREWIARALEVAPRLRNAHYNLALIAEQTGDLVLARREYERELELFPGNTEAGVNLGLLCGPAGDLACAERAFSGAIEYDEDFAIAHYLLARTRIEQGRVDGETLRLARRAAELDPSFRRARQLTRQLETALAASR